MKAAIYSRFSTDRQTESSIADQVRVCTEHAKAQGWRVTHKFDDQGISGAAILNRPGVGRMLEASIAHEFDVLLVVDLTRLSRSMGDLAKTIDRLIARRVRVIGVQDGYDSARKGHKLQAGLSGIIGESFREMISDRTYAALESRAKERKPTGGRAYGYEDGKVDARQAKVVREIFTRFADDNESCRAIAAALNAKRIPSPGSTWNRVERRAAGWMGSGIRAMLLNERYRGLCIWNMSAWKKDPDSGKRERHERPRAEWITHQDESLRIVTDAVWSKAQKRFRKSHNANWSKAGGKPRFLLSGLLRCDACDSHYIMCNATDYSCGSTRGGACKNRVRVRRDHVEDVLLTPIRRDLLSPARVERMAQEMRRYFAERIKAQRAEETERPKELADLDSRLSRLRTRLKSGDPDLSRDDISAAIERVESQRRELESMQPMEKASAKIVAMLPKAAAMYRAQIAQGLDGDAHAASKARVVLRDLLGEIRLVPEPKGGLIAHWNLAPAALLRAVGTSGSGGGLPTQKFLIPLKQ
jgi:DNA invertase Pin-like site-specific DNA recombinase